jgi:hypothetical protein
MMWRVPSVLRSSFGGVSNTIRTRGCSSTMCSKKVFLFIFLFMNPRSIPLEVWHPYRQVKGRLSVCIVNFERRNRGSWSIVTNFNPISKARELGLCRSGSLTQLGENEQCRSRTSLEAWTHSLTTQWPRKDHIVPDPKLKGLSTPFLSFQNTLISILCNSSLPYISINLYSADGTYTLSIWKDLHLNLTSIYRRMYVLFILHIYRIYIIIYINK